MQCNSDHSTHPDLWAQGITSINRLDLILCSTFNPQRIPEHCKAHPCYWWLSNAGGKQGKCVYNSGSEPSFRIHAVYRGWLDFDARQPFTDMKNILCFLLDKNTPIKEILISSKEVFKLWPWAMAKMHRIYQPHCLRLFEHVHLCFYSHQKQKLHGILFILAVCVLFWGPQFSLFFFEKLTTI